MNLDPDRIALYVGGWYVLAALSAVVAGLVLATIIIRNRLGCNDDDDDPHGTPYGDV